MYDRILQTWLLTADCLPHILEPVKELYSILVVCLQHLNTVTGSASMFCLQLTVSLQCLSLSILFYACGIRLYAKVLVRFSHNGDRYIHFGGKIDWHFLDFLHSTRLACQSSWLSVLLTTTLNILCVCTWLHSSFVAGFYTFFLNSSETNWHMDQLPVVWR